MYTEMSGKVMQPPMYVPSMEHDACGIGACIDIKGRVSRQNVEDALKIVENLEHRAGKDATGETGDGVGILMQIPHRLLKEEAQKLGISLGERRSYGVGMFFFPGKGKKELDRQKAMRMFEVICEKKNLKFLGWREVPVDPTVLGEKAASCQPAIYQAFIERPAGIKADLDFDRRLYVVRKTFEQSVSSTYVLSLSCRTVVYKGMFLVGQLRTFYKDLMDERCESAIAIVHSRFSTNTFPSWERAHPYRMIVHNGEINTIRGNQDKMNAREENLDSEALGGDLTAILPVIDGSGSDSAMLDNTLEFLTMSGMDLPQAVMITIPEPWEKDPTISREKKDFYQYYATMMEPWDGPASILFTDGDQVGAVLDRNGLRPSRYYITADDRLVLSSEVGVLDVEADNIVVKDRLRPGKMLLVDLKEGKVIDDDKLKHRYASKHPYGEWLDRYMVSLKDLRIPNKKVAEVTGDDLKRMQTAFGYNYESIYDHILPMAEKGVEPTAAMGVDTALPVLDPEHHPLFHFFKQLFAQVTNPPIDSLREEIVTSTSVYIGTSGNVLQDDPAGCNVLKVLHPILTDTDVLKIRAMKAEGLKSKVLSMTYFAGTPLKTALDHLFIEADRAYKEGANVLILTDRDVDESRVPIPSLLAVSALNRHLIDTKKRTSVSIILESAEPCEVHHFAVLLGYGATAINPYLAHETIRELIAEGSLDKDLYAAVDDYNRAILSGVVKIAAKMGISTVQSYRGSQIFEAIGLEKDVIDKYFTGTVCRVGGISLDDIDEYISHRHERAYDPLGLSVEPAIDSVGDHKMRSGREEHMYDPLTIHLLQQAVRKGDYSIFKEYSEHLENGAEKTLRSLMDFIYAEEPISLEEVESEDEIVKRFKTGAMSFGSISREAHEALAIAMNHLKGYSNTGEGGEEPERLATKGQKDDKCSAIKQVASGRFGVTLPYLMSAKEVQIKMAQGAKPGEGGHLPGTKVYPWVAACRHSTPGVSLISPPPHHDIYSIEDLAELIYDLKNAAQKARINVKLVSEAGVGTVAAGVAKAGAQVVLISGYDGGTGAAPMSSIHSAGLPWELGLAETHQTLIMNGLRDRVKVEADGKLMSGRDVAIACMLGAEEFGFATAPLVALGCVMMRVCNLDTCPMGIATQNPELRKRFRGKPEHVENYMRFVARELREYMAKLGIRTVDELVGRTDLLKVREDLDDEKKKITLAKMLDNPYAGKVPCIFDPSKAYDFRLEETVDERVLTKELLKAIKKNEKKTINVKIVNTDRSFGTILGTRIVENLGEKVPEDQYIVRATGSGGQSFGAFIPGGLTLEVEGDANDYFGKGLSGGKLVLYPPKKATFRAEDNIIVGNVALYGATAGKAFISGISGERFAVRNSGVTAVVEGCGDHALEYMTGGVVVVLGRVGKNAAAGMSGGIGYILDEDGDLYMNLNKGMIHTENVTEDHDIQLLKGLIQEHLEATNSEKARKILADFENYLGKFKKVIPNDYQKMRSLIAKGLEKGLSREEAELAAFEEVTGSGRKEAK